MSQENVEIVRRAIEAANRGDWDGVLRDAAPDLVFDNSRALGEWRGVQIGHDQVKRMFEAFAEPWESIRVDLDEVIEVDDRVLDRRTATMHGRGGIEVTTTTYYVSTFRGGKVIRIVYFENRAEALEAAGLSE
jgi:ketosteroid isomerase-like protein